MVNKVLFCATVDSHFKSFHIPYLKWFKEMGWEVHIAANGNIEIPYVDHKFNIPIQRSPFHLKNIKAIRNLSSIINKNNYQIIHCHTPMGGILARLAARKARIEGTKVIYTAHGFHFCKGAPLLNWVIYYPIEKLMAHYTDCLITINQEDYELSVKRFNTNKIEHINGVGINTDEFKPINDSQKILLKKSFGYQPDDFLLFYAAEFNKNKNQQFLLNSLKLVKEHIPNVRLLLAGEGPLLNQCKQLAKSLGISNMVDFLGYRNDLKEIVPMCDVAVASSLREGLPVNIMEAMACGLPIVAVDNRGHRELVMNDINGWLVNNNDPEEFSEKLITLAKSNGFKKKLGLNGREITIQKYSIDYVLIKKSEIYKSYMKEMEDVMWAFH